MMICIASLTGCTIVSGNFCDVYNEVGMTGDQARKIDRVYAERILVNELMYERCK